MGASSKESPCPITEFRAHILPCWEMHLDIGEESRPHFMRTCTGADWLGGMGVGEMLQSPVMSEIKLAASKELVFLAPAATQPRELV